MVRVNATDPGTRLCGYASFSGRQPSIAGVVKSNARTHIERAVDMGAQLARLLPFATSHIVVERPVIYPDSRERDSDIVDLTTTAGIIGGILLAQVIGPVLGDHVALHMPTPREWKGTIKKSIHNERTKARCPAAVELVNKIPKGQRNHVWDAVGLAIWQLERIGQWDS